MKIAEAQYKCEVCGNITSRPNKMMITVMPYNHANNSGTRRSKEYDVCEECSYGTNVAGTFINWFKKLWNKK